MFDMMKKAIAITAIAVGIVVMLVLPASAENTDGAVSGINRTDATVNGNAESRGTANFTMSFSGSGTTKGDFKGNGKSRTDVDGAVVNEDNVYRPVVEK